MKTLRSFVVRRPLIARGLVTFAVGVAAHFGGDLAAQQTLTVVTALGGLLGLEAQRHLTPIRAPKLPRNVKAQRYDP